MRCRVLPFACVASAQVVVNPGTGDNGLSISSIGHAIASVAWVTFTIIAVIMFVVAGMLFLTALGDAEKIKRARDAFLWGLVGIVVAIVAFSITSVVSHTLGA